MGREYLRAVRVLWWLLALGTVWRVATAVTPPAPNPPARLEREPLEAFFRAHVARDRESGLSVAVYHRGEPVLVNAYGWADREQKQPLTSHSLLAIGSVSKQFTCAAILLLAEDGKLSVQDPVARYYPDLTRAQDIRLLDLMRHTSGYPDYYPLDFVDRRMAANRTTDDLIREYAGGKLDFEPGSRWSYSNTGFLILARVVEKVSGRSFADFLQERILAPLGMKETVYEASATDPRVAKGYASFALGPLEQALPEGANWLGGAGGVWSTAEDLARWDLGLADGRVLRPASWKLFTTGVELPDGRFTQYGCGVGVSVREGRQVVAHSGAVAGFSALNVLIPSTRSALVLLSNREDGLGRLRDQLLPLLLGDPARIPTVQGPPATDLARRLFAQLQAGRPDRAAYAPAFNEFLDARRVEQARRQLKGHGTPTGAELVSQHERGGMEVSQVRLRFRQGSLMTLMYRRPDGVVEQFFVSAE